VVSCYIFSTSYDKSGWPFDESTSPRRTARARFDTPD
jgi:hypothetical protein